MLASFEGLTDLVADPGAPRNYRIYPGAAPQDKAFPVVGFSRIASGHEEAFGSDSSIVASFWRVTCVAPTYDETEAIHDRVRKALQRRRGEFGGITVHDTLIETEVGPDPAEDPTRFESFVDVQLRTTEV
jgi:hypothetical protein